MASPPQWVRGPLLGRGSTATVSLATFTSTTFAVKSADLHSSAPLQREQRLLSSIPSSPHLISYLGFDVTYDGGSGGRTLFNLFLEYAPGGSLSDRIAGKGLKEEHEMRRYTRGILMGLSHLHSLGVAHCDVKPGNVLLAADGSAKIADLGCAKWVSGAGDDQPAVSGTPLFMSPEAARGEEQGTAADVWAVGCTVIEMATGRQPWPGIRDAASAVHRIAFSGESPEIPTWVSPEAREFLGKCLERDPRRRPTADELLRHTFIASVSPSDSSPCTPATSWRSPKCVLDRDMWDSLEEEEEEEEEDDDDNDNDDREIVSDQLPPAGTVEIATPAGNPDLSERIRQLADEASGSSSQWGFSWDGGGDWITIRRADEKECSVSPPVEVEERSAAGEADLLESGPVFVGNDRGYPRGFVVNIRGFCHEQSFFCPYVPGVGNVCGCCANHCGYSNRD